MSEYKGHSDLVEIRLSEFAESNPNKFLDPEYNIYTIFKEIKRRILDRKDEMVSVDSKVTTVELKEFKHILADLDSDIFTSMLANGSLKEGFRHRGTIFIDGKGYLVSDQNNTELIDLIQSYHILYRIISGTNTFNWETPIEDINISIFCKLDKYGYIDLNEYLDVQERKMKPNVIYGGSKRKEIQTEWYPVKGIEPYLSTPGVEGTFFYEKTKDKFYVYISLGNTVWSLRRKDDFVSIQSKRKNIIKSGIIGRESQGIYNIYAKFVGKLLNTKKVSNLMANDEFRMKLEGCLIKLNNDISPYDTMKMIDDILLNPKSFKGNYRLLMTGDTHLRYMIVDCKDEEVENYQNLLNLQNRTINNCRDFDSNQGYIIELNLNDEDIFNTKNDLVIVGVPKIFNENYSSLISFAEEKIGGDFYALTKYPGINLM